jgi:uncharacterized membrane protein
MARLLTKLPPPAAPVACRRGRRPCRVVAQQTQRYVAGKVDVEMPLAAVQQLPVPAQAACVATIFAALGLGTQFASDVVAPAIEHAVPSLFAFSRATWPLLGTTFVAAGVAHFTLHDEFCTMMPQRGAWGLWYLPGSNSFHVNWTGVAEIFGGAGVLLGAIPAVAESLPLLSPMAALGLYALTWAVTPANVYMFTHNAPGPGPANSVIPVAGHAVRFLLQVFLLSTLWGIAHPPGPG